VVVAVAVAVAVVVGAVVAHWLAFDAVVWVVAVVMGNLRWV